MADKWKTNLTPKKLRKRAKRDAKKAIRLAKVRNHKFTMFDNYDDFLAARS